MKSLRLPYWDATLSCTVSGMELYHGEHLRIGCFDFSLIDTNTPHAHINRDKKFLGDANLVLVSFSWPWYKHDNALQCVFEL